ncbi:e9imm peptide [Kitasatospora phosalacinea]|uniref:e9imm peptide n=1 Tax=Kitasatospora phosalacinea TaxID=2065 RepID=UPI003660BAE5
MDRETAATTVQRVMDGDYADDEEAARLLEALGRALGCTGGYVSDLVFWPKEPEPTAEEVVDQALAYRPVAL